MPSPGEMIDEVAQGQFVQRRLNSAVETAKGWYTRAEHSNIPLVKLSLDTFERTTGWLSRPLVSTISRVGQPVVQRLDTSLSVAYTTLDGRLIKPAQERLQQVSAVASHENERLSRNVTELKDKVVTSAWFQKVDQIFKQAQATVSLKAFSDAATEAYASLEKKTFEDFTAALRAKLSSWDERYLLPAKVYYCNAQERLKGIDLRDERHRRSEQIKQYLLGVGETLAHVWENNTHQVAVSAVALYHTALDQYVALAKKQGQVNVTELLSVVRDRLGAAWSDNLVAPITELFYAAKQVAITDLQKLSEAQDSARTAGQSLVQDVYNYVDQKVDSILTLSENTIDYFLPPVEDEDEVKVEQRKEAVQDDTQEQEDSEDNDEDETMEDTESTQVESTSVNPNPDRTVKFRLRAMTSSVSKRLQKKASVKIGELRQFSATRLASIIHVDLISYAENFIDQAQEKVKPLVSNSVNTYQTSVANARQALKDLKDTCVHVAQKPVGKYLSPRLLVLRKKLRAVKDEAKSLFVLTTDIVGSRWLVDLHKDVTALVLKLLKIHERDPQFQGYVDKVKHLLHTLGELTVCWIHVDTNNVDADDNNVDVSREQSKDASPVQDPPRELY